MPTPIFQPYSPGIGDDLNKRIKGLTNAYIDTTQQLQWLLTHLDEKNVLKAQSVVADWVYAGNIKTNQLIAGETLIDNALIKSLSASKITAGTITASISLSSPVIVGGVITGTTIISTNNLYVGDSSDLGATKRIYFNDYMNIEAKADNGWVMKFNCGYLDFIGNIRGDWQFATASRVAGLDNHGYATQSWVGSQGYATQSYVQNVSSNLSTLISNTMSNHIANYHS